MIICKERDIRSILALYETVEMLLLMTGGESKWVAQLVKRLDFGCSLPNQLLFLCEWMGCLNLPNLVTYLFFCFTLEKRQHEYVNIM